MSDVLVAYFSASGMTAKVAQAIVDAKGADVCEIKPQVPYTKEDLDWTDPQSRSSIEMKDKSFRPAMQDVDVNIAQYNTIYLGFPIWWYVAPTIVNTFLESKDFNGKNIILFATAGSSDWGNTAAELASSVSDTTQITTTKVLKSGFTPQDLQDFVSSLS